MIVDTFKMIETNQVHYTEYPKVYHNFINNSQKPQNLYLASSISRP